MTKKVLVLSGKRGGYGAMKQLLEAIDRSPVLELYLVLTDQHLSHGFGYTIKEVEKEFTVSAALELNHQDGSPISRARAMARLTDLFSLELEKIDPDACVLYGDRSEVLVAAMCCNLFNIPIFHIQGGDKSGSTDELFRHAVTKLSHVHFPSCSDSAGRIIQLGEQPDRINCVGDCHIDKILSGNFMAEAEVRNLLDLNNDRPVVILLQHSETSEPQDSYRQICVTLEALSGFDINIVAVYPCSDPGYDGIVRGLTESKLPNLRLYKNLDAPLFWGLMSFAGALIGNSSAGIVESACFGLPTINIGRRQLNRICSQNVIHVEHDSSQISIAIYKALFDLDFKSIAKNVENLYGDGHAGERIATSLEDTDLGIHLIQKEFRDIAGVEFSVLDR